MTHNQRVAGSSPAGPTLIINGLCSFLNVTHFSFAYNLHTKAFKRNTESHIYEISSNQLAS